MNVALKSDLSAAVRADLDLADRELRARTAMLEAVYIVLCAARSTLADIALDDPAHGELYRRYGEVRLAFLDARVDESGEVPIT